MIRTGADEAVYKLVPLLRRQNYLERRLAEDDRRRCTRDEIAAIDFVLAKAAAVVGPDVVERARARAADLDGLASAHGALR